MTMVLNDEQTMLIDAVRHLLAGDLADGAALVPLDAERARQLWRQCAEMGWLQTCAPEASGGLGLSLVDAALMVEEMGRRLLPLPVADAMAMLGYLITAEGPDTPLKQLARWLDGEAYMALASDADGDDESGTAQDDGIDRRSPNLGLVTHAISDATALRLSWQETHLTLSAHAVDHLGYGIDPLIATGRLVTHSPPQWQVKRTCPEPTWTRFCMARRCLRLAELLGVGAQALDLASVYACEREQFGKPIGANQAIKHRLADNWMALDNARLLLHEACELTDQHGEAAQASVLMAELLITEAALATAGQAIQTFGAMGITWECPAHLYLKRARHLCAILRRDGDATFILDRLWALI